MNKNTENHKSPFLLTTAVSLIFLAAALFVFTLQNGKRITDENRQYLVDNAVQIGESIDNALTEGYNNIRILSELVSLSLTGPTFDITSMQGLIQNSVFDFMEFADADGMDHNITGGVSDARDRQYYLDAKAGNCGMELIYVSRATHETLLMFYSPIYYEGRFIGSLVGVYQAANRITNLLHSEYFGERATAYFATDAGRIIASDSDFDPQNELYVTDLAGSDIKLAARLDPKRNTEEVLTFTLPGNDTGGCRVRLSANGGYLIQIFPPEASRQMISKANTQGYVLVGFLLLLYVAVLIALIRFYRRQQAQVEEARNQAEIANQAKTNFLFNMSHDIRTPMNAITGFTDKAIRHKDEPEVLVESLEKVRSSSAYLLRIINDILDMAKIESGKLELREELHFAEEGQNTLLEIFGAEASRKGIEFRTRYNVEHKYVWLDESRTSQIIANLISNAIKYTPPGGRILYSVEEGPAEREGYGKFTVRLEDSGIGMSPEFLARVFDAFEREQSATKSGVQGTGLGMAIVKKLADAMNGTIDVVSEPGKGTVVTFITEHRIATAGEIESFLADAAREEAERAGMLKGKRILLVEDNELNREIATDLLEEKGILVETAADGSIALEMVRAIAERKDYRYYAAVLMDVQMPVMDGYEATRLIREIPCPEDVHLPIIAMTANAFEEDRQNSLAAGMDDHIAKPIDVNKLFEALAKAL